MSRRGQARHSMVVDDSEVLDMESDASDPVIGAIRYGMDTIMKIVNDTIPYIPNEDDNTRKDTSKKMESALLNLMEAELTYSHTTAIVNQVVDELNVQDNPEMETREFLEAVESINELSNRRIEEYKDTLTTDMLQSHPTFLRMRNELEGLLEKGDRSEVEITDPADAETEEEVDLEDDEGDHEVIPELDPITKQPLRDPVRNRSCRHIYGKSAILQLIKKNPKLRCPAMGCGNKNFVKASDLEEDPRLTARVLGLPIPSTPRASTSRSVSHSPRKGKGRRRR